MTSPARRCLVRVSAREVSRSRSSSASASSSASLSGGTRDLPNRIVAADVLAPLGPEWRNWQTRGTQILVRGASPPRPPPPAPPPGPLLPPPLPPPPRL